MGAVTPEWVAGFFDGEGTVDIRLARSHGGKYMRFELRVQIVQRDRRPLELIAARYGGSVQAPKQNCGAWVTTSRNAAAFLREILPHSLCKADQIGVALRFADRMYKPAEEMAGSGRRGFWRLPAEEMKARLALMNELRGIRDNAGLRPKARNNSLQAQAAVYALPRDQASLENRGCPPSRGQDCSLYQSIDQVGAHE